jgi:GNAT superfamily N-acetyltransferase
MDECKGDRVDLLFFVWFCRSLATPSFSGMAQTDAAQHGSFVIRSAEKADVPRIFQFVKDLAEYEKAPEEAVLTLADLEQSLFGAAPQVYCLVSEQDGTVTGMAVWHLNYSTWKGKHGIYLEDLFVSPPYRGRGHGKALLVQLARICVERGYPRLQWWVLDWNQPAIDFYRSLGAEAMDEWTTYRVSGPALQRLASNDSAPAHV